MAKPAFDVTIRGVALSTFGLTEWQSISGLGLVTNGFIWECKNIWFEGCGWTTAQTATWTLYVGVSNAVTWTLYNSGATTTSWTTYTTYGIEDC